MKAPTHFRTVRTITEHALSVWAVLVLSTALHAVEIKKFAFSGTINSVDNGNFILDDSIVSGTPFTGYYIFDADTPDTNYPTDVGDYQHTEANYGIVIKIGKYIFRTDPAHVDFLIETVNRSQDNYLLRSYNNVCSLPIPVDHISWQLDDDSGTALNSDDLPSNPINLSSFTQSFGLTVVGGSLDQSYHIRGQVTSLTTDNTPPAPIPAVTKRDAFELQLATKLGYFYQFQSTPNLSVWTDFDAPLLGDGTIISKFITRPAKASKMFRAIIRNQLGAVSNPADVLNFKFTGRVTSYDNQDSELDDSVRQGAPITGFYTFKNNVTDTNSDPTVGDYEYSTPESGMVVKIGNYIFRTNPEHVNFLIEIVDRSSIQGGDHYLLRSYNNVSSHPVIVDHISWQLDNDAGNAISNDVLPLTPPPLANYTQSFGLNVEGGYVNNRMPHTFRIRSTVESVEIAPLVIPIVPPVQIKLADEYCAETVTGYFYQWQSSLNGTDWINEGSPFIGDGLTASKFVPRNPALSYRVIITN